MRQGFLRFFTLFCLKNVLSPYRKQDFIDFFSLLLYAEDMNEIDLSPIISLGYPLHLSAVQETASTSDDLKAVAESAPDCSVRIASRQTGGRGREGRSFWSPDGLYMSILLPYQGDALPYLTHLAAIAVAHAIRSETTQPAVIKWVNDVFVEGRKVCGILTESIAALGKRRIVLGIGVNANTPTDDIPAALREIVGTIRCDKSALAASILKELLSRLDRFSLEATRREYRELCFLVGEKVLVQKGADAKPATVLALDDALGLSVLYDDGSRETLISGEVHLIVR